MRKVSLMLALLVVFSASSLAGQIGMTITCQPEQTCTCPPEQTCVSDGQIGMTGAAAPESAEQTDVAAAAAPADADTTIEDIIESINIYAFATWIKGF